MFSNITAEEWKVFWRVIDKIDSTEEGSESEKYIELWKRADEVASYAELESVAMGLNDTAGEVEPSN